MKKSIISLLLLLLNVCFLQYFNASNDNLPDQLLQEIPILAESIVDDLREAQQTREGFFLWFLAELSENPEQIPQALDIITQHPGLIDFKLNKLIAYNFHLQVKEDKDTEPITRYILENREALERNMKTAKKVLATHLKEAVLQDNADEMIRLVTLGADPELVEFENGELEVLGELEKI